MKRRVKLGVELGRVSVSTGAGGRVQKLHGGILCVLLPPSWRKSPGKGWAGQGTLPPWMGQHVLYDLMKL